jgi:hypothetical protein
MATADLGVDLSGIHDWQRPLAFVFGAVLAVLGFVALSGFLTTDGLLLGIFGIPLWLGVTAIVAGLLGIALSFYAGGATTFNKVAAGLVLPAVLFLAVVDWALAVGGLSTLVLGLLALLLAVALVAVGTVLFYRHPLALVLPVVALLAIADWVFSLTAMAPSGAAVNLPTIGLLVVLAVVVGLVGFEGGLRVT